MDHKGEAGRVKFSLRHGVQRSVGAGPRHQGAVNNAKTGQSSGEVVWARKINPDMSPLNRHHSTQDPHPEDRI